ncbi:MAG: hypothetical protein EON59_06025 [Alphaproteobacteria bacterium]|nr:MAG: hypothetical protein EON59_06025 [Alphaproteobacteria bacterium]
MDPMRVTDFIIRNFRGIKQTQIKLGGKPGQVVTLIGLNESGKTTILEALSTFISADPKTIELIETIYAKSEASSFVPRDKRGRFTDRISIKTKVQLSDDDIADVKLAIRSKNAMLVGDFPRVVDIDKAIIFKDSKVVDNKQYWTLNFKYKKINGSLVHTASATDPVWHEAVRALRANIPEILYFPTFLFAMPKRIYLTEIEGEDVKNSYYRNLLSYVMKSVDKNYSIKTHITDRVAALIGEHDLAGLSDADLSGDIDSVVGDISTEISRVVIGAWKDILGKPLPQMRIGMRWSVDAAKDNAVYVELFVSEGDYTYSLNERSLGFRWFFSFLLFTQFRRVSENNRPTIFLFDEPASHLHASAQIQLLESFTKIMDPEDHIIYSTHSHYMINPLWLEKAYIIQNKAVSSDDDYEPFTKRPNDIAAIPYGRFVSENPNRLSYFQPALDSLHYRASLMEFGRPAIILEGKFDYFPFRYLLKRSGIDLGACCFPANGAGDLSVLISLFRGWNIPFVIVLDADKQGKIEKARYFKDFSLGTSEILTLDEVDSSLDGKAFEAIYGSDVSSLLEENSLALGGKLKAEGAALFQLLDASDDKDANLDETLAMFNKLLAAIQSRLQDQKLG